MSAVTLAIDSIAAGGDGVGRTDGMVVFVPRSAPGDIVTARLAGKKRFARGAILRIDTPSSDRVEPACPHFVVDRCGGCQLQHLAYPAQLRAKSAIIRDGLTRIGKRAVEAPPVEASPTQWRYRTKLTLAIRNLPTGWVLGLHPFDDAATVFQLGDCPISDERVVAVWRSIFAATALLPSEAERGSVRVGGDGAATVVIEGGQEWVDARRFFDALPMVRSLWWKPANLPRAVVASRGDAVAVGASFTQVNSGMAATLHAYVLDRVRRHAPASVVDAYAGSGATAIPLASDGIAVTAIELDRAAVASCAARLPTGSRALAGRVEELLPGALPADVVLLNPPRMGLADAVPVALESTSPRPRAIIYVSCNAATLGRDLSRMPGYRIDTLRGFDMFPQTAHVETVCELVPVMT
jgi:23S rRNA (uracil1939-C5)-methyltransferase